MRLPASINPFLVCTCSTSHAFLPPDKTPRHFPGVLNILAAAMCCLREASDNWRDAPALGGLQSWLE